MKEELVKRVQWLDNLIVQQSKNLQDLTAEVHALHGNKRELLYIISLFDKENKEQETVALEPSPVNECSATTDEEKQDAA